MNLSRFITITILSLTLTAAAHAQQVAQPATADMTDGTTTEKVEARRVATTAHLFTRASAPLVKTIETKDSTAAKPEPQANPDDEWQFQLTPYLWIAGISGRAGVGPGSVDVDTGITDSDVKLNFGFMGTFEARKNRLVLLTDLQYSNLGTDNDTPGPLFTRVEADFKTFILDPEVGYRVLDNPEKGAFLDVLGGIRYWHLRTDITFERGLLPNIFVTRSRSWVDGVAGLRGRAHVTPKLFLTGKADLGGGGSNFTYQLFGGGGYLVGKRYALIAAYRYLSVNYNKNDFLFDMALHGPVFGFGIKF
jgi:hypothetical protein